MGNKEFRESRIQDAFGDELSSLSEVYCEFVERALLNCCPEYFWHMPASGSGKHHPRGTQGLGGLVRHVKYCCWWADQIAVGWGSRSGECHVDMDVVKTALLLHDIHKFEKPGDVSIASPEGKPVEAHGLWAADVIKAFFVDDDIAEYVDLDSVCDCIAYHMGRWTATPFRKQAIEIDNNEVAIVQYIDYVASRPADEFLYSLRNGKGGE